MRICIYSLIGILLAGPSVRAQKRSRFNEHPAERVALIDRLGRQASAEKATAKAWAAKHGRSMREEKNGRVRELMAIRNGMPLYYTTYNANAAISTGASLVRTPALYNLDGAGITVGVWDGGSVLTTHQELTGRVDNKDSVASNDHSTHVGGTIAASGVNSNAKGMAPASSIDSYDWDDDYAEVAASGASAPGQSDKIYLSNHSYGYDVDSSSLYYLYGLYNLEVKNMDSALHGLQYCLPFVAAGNDQGDATYKGGYDTISLHGIAKNVMTVGAIKNAYSGSTRSVGNADMTDFSSWGPADDGRIKPDIVAHGYSVYSCNNTGNSEYYYSYGTSMASPNACGSAALLVEYYKELFSGGAMRASTLKGLIIHTADDLGNAGPDYSYGWGLMNTLAAAELLTAYADGAVARLTEATVTTSEPSDTYSFMWNGVDPIRVTLCWTDPAGAVDSDDDNRSADLVNDLDLKVTGPGGTYYPYKLNYASPSSVATSIGENNIDNVEQVYIVAPSEGLYTVSVDYDGSLDNDSQWYSLLVSGNSSDSDGDDIPDYWESQYFLSPTGAVANADPDMDGANNLTEYITGYDPTDKSSVFKMSSYELPTAAGDPTIIHWPTKAGRIYSVSSTHNLKYVDFDPFPDGTNLPYTQNSYTDSVEYVIFPRFYRVGVKLDH